jgi:hypothetical protein
MTNDVGQEPSEHETRSFMRAWRVHEFGPPGVMRFENVPRPTAGPGEVVVKVEAAGVGPWDGWIRAGKSALPQPLPLTLGSDLSGEIVSVGPAVSDWRAGDRVYGVTNPRFVGAYAEYAAASAGMLSRMPGTLTYSLAGPVRLRRAGERSDRGYSRCGRQRWSLCRAAGATPRCSNRGDGIRGRSCVRA